MVKQTRKSRVKVILNLMVLVLGLFIVSQFLTKNFDNRSKAAENFQIIENIEGIIY